MSIRKNAGVKNLPGETLDRQRRVCIPTCYFAQQAVSQTYDSFPFVMRGPVERRTNIEQLSQPVRRYARLLRVAGLDELL